MSMPSAAGTAGRPGIRITSPAIGTTNTFGGLMHDRIEYPEEAKKE